MRAFYIILLVAGCIAVYFTIVDFIIKIQCSNISQTADEYISLYYKQNIYSLQNIYAITFTNIIVGLIGIVCLYFGIRHFRFKFLWILVLLEMLIIGLNAMSMA